MYVLADPIKPLRIPTDPEQKPIKPQISTNPDKSYRTAIPVENLINLKRLNPSVREDVGPRSPVLAGGPQPCAPTAGFGEFMPARRV